MPQRKRIAVLIPAYNEESSIGPMLEALISQLQSLDYTFRILVVDDGSTDGTADAAWDFSGRIPMTVVQLSRNFGKETALLAGLDQVDEDAVIIIDADLQHPVELIPEFIDYWQRGYKNIYGVKSERRGESRIKSLLLRVFYWAINSRSNFFIEPNSLDFRLLDRLAIDAVCRLRERVRFTKGLYAWVGFRSIGIPFVPPPRRSGNTHFTRRALGKLGWDGLTSFSDFPLRISATLGVAISLLSICYGSYILLRTLIIGADVPGWATLVVAAMLLGGLQLFFLGMTGIYIRNIFEETKQRPLYIVADTRSNANSAAARIVPIAEGKYVPPLPAGAIRGQSQSAQIPPAAERP